MYRDQYGEFVSGCLGLKGSGRGLIMAVKFFLLTIPIMQPYSKTLTCAKKLLVNNNTTCLKYKCLPSIVT